MKRFLIIAIVPLVFMGCLAGPQTFVIPDEPIYKELNILKFPDGFCMENADFDIWVSNQKKLWEHKNELRKLLEDIQSGTKDVEIDSSDEVVASK